MKYKTKGRREGNPKFCWRFMIFHYFPVRVSQYPNTPLGLKLVCHANPHLTTSLVYVSSKFPPPLLYISLPFSSLSPPTHTHTHSTTQFSSIPSPFPMGDRSPPHQLQAHSQQRPYGQDPASWKLAGGRLPDFPYQQQQQQQGPSASKILAVVTLVPVGGTLLGLSGLTLAVTLFGLAVSTPVFLLFSPVIVPAAVAIFLAVMAFLTSGVFGLTALSSLSWVYRYIRKATGTMPEQMDMAKRRMQDMAGYVGQKTKDVGQEIQSRAQEGRRTATEQHERRTT